MALDSFDDQYINCTQEMERELDALNQTEFTNNAIYAKAWKVATDKWAEVRRTQQFPWPPGFREEHAVAILAYTLEEQPLYVKFNSAVREAGRSRNHYMQSFHFKTFHFLLTRAISLLQGEQTPKCHMVYRGVLDKRFQAKTGKTIRFGSFTSSSLNEERALEFGSATFFTIQTCHGPRIRQFSQFYYENEVLIPPYESFQVIDSRSGAHSSNEIHLRSMNKTRTYNCEYIKGAAATGTKALLWPLLLFWSTWLVLSPLGPF
ncbi:GPI-linked NAD(P)(+)--arginine ADP-ribosyltransferase 1-like [Ornithorhynchus anatinus]|nr:GPI-linked NAD(P)(+)--arginine ADP-ribosyltransferase 1-like [Ornithorhynchus anatinus]